MNFSEVEIITFRFEIINLLAKKAASDQWSTMSGALLLLNK